MANELALTVWLCSSGMQFLRWRMLLLLVLLLLLLLAWDMSNRLFMGCTRTTEKHVTKERLRESEPCGKSYTEGELCSNNTQNSGEATSTPPLYSSSKQEPPTNVLERNGCKRSTWFARTCFWHLPVSKSSSTCWSLGHISS